MTLPRCGSLHKPIPTFILALEATHPCNGVRVNPEKDVAETLLTMFK